MDALEGVDELVVECHCEFELFQACFDLLLDILVLDCDDFEHFFKMIDKLFEIVIFPNNLVDGQSNTHYSFPTNIVCYLVLLRDKVSYTHKTANFLLVPYQHFVLSNEDDYAWILLGEDSPDTQGSTAEPVA